MSIKYNWEYVKQFDNEKGMELFLLANVKTSTEKSNVYSCTICADNSHKMMYKLRVCSSVECNSQSICSFKYKVLKCCRNNKYEVYSLNSHNIGQKSETDKNHGLTNAVKDIIENLIFQKNVYVLVPRYLQY